MTEGGKVCPYLHIPLQSGDDGILEKMRRKYTAKAFREFIDVILERVPDIGLGTDAIVGFPGEGEEAFRNTYRLVEAIPFNNIHVFSFSAREGTGAHRMNDRVPGDVIAERSRILHDLADEKRRAFYDQQTGRVARVLFEERNADGRFVGFTDNYTKVGVETERDLNNRFGDVRVTGVIAQGTHRPPLAVGELENGAGIRHRSDATSAARSDL
jgi:threonylcarbamoyladenosine tRNA methylthiotransferase MtaB